MKSEASAGTELNHTTMKNAGSPPQTWGQKLKMIGPGFVVAATGVGTADMITAIVIGTSFGMAFVWAVIVGAILKYFLNEGVGRWYLATGQTILQGWHSLGRWATGYFGVYTVIWGYIYGAAAALTCGLGMHAMFPIMPVWAWAVVHSLLGFALVWTGRYLLFERIMTVLIGVMFITIIGTAVLFLPSLGEFAGGIVPKVPDGSFVLALGLIGGVGGTITMASYGYWLKEKGWNGKGWISIMRLDAKAAYAMTGLFCMAALIIGAKFLYGTDVELRGDQGLINLALMLGEEFGTPMRWLFLVAFWSAAFTSLLGVWNGVPYLFADFIKTIRLKKGEVKAIKPVSEKEPMYRLYLAWLTFPPMLIFFFGKPVELIILYGALGALFMPFLAISLVVLLNSKRVEPEYRNKWLANAVLIGCILMFAFLGINELQNIFK
ncbi:Mn2+ and Fe2+ transporters of the NRAMP family [Fictibacillus solisalsi]|uniref:Mn2+ and Fe2+ transporters of the NRAMP family n=1 Tax=Fictibacillus solisalsi TaxID=459525 RepID=A0A1G9XPR2_9BACL|nr:Nramp family divalent metal transporter [Fictibacillus solisalsi]SDM98767.1 Mn2+ and Fe2+ transporters of the NRAMP family [Fictibacillus solisalsi]